jgi:hypothetical protein
LANLASFGVTHHVYFCLIPRRFFADGLPCDTSGGGATESLKFNNVSKTMFFAGLVSLPCGQAITGQPLYQVTSIKSQKPMMSNSLRLTGLQFRRHWRNLSSIQRRRLTVDRLNQLGECIKNQKTGCPINHFSC